MSISIGCERWTLPDDFLETRDQPKDDLRDRLPALRRKRG